MRAIHLALLILLSAPTLGHAQLRSIPEQAVKATMKPPRDGLVELGKHVFRLAPGAQIRSVDNRIMLPAMIGSEQVVRYELDSSGALYRVWILSPEEVDLPAPKQK
ncbi:MAG: hypothetical protein KKD25_13920 [Gammaproteobacteria bacterium]|jgi:hypothetical protein|nr:hypothetical protein [Gammaproteobacteria bacterium]MBU0770484.1 hypothetical protein [Gammaproteobacteria bacterium]MBU0856340.1 hypothetical protein [Gammaproteobacteria bacterium]MBU1845339.1 hypothetical protein [Gammaproteobacteria bacterium]